jgi:hypothetical protein
MACRGWLKANQYGSASMSVSALGTARNEMSADGGLGGVWLGAMSAVAPMSGNECFVLRLRRVRCVTGCCCGGLRRCTTPDQHVRAQVGTVRPDDRPALGANPTETRGVIAHRLEDRPGQQSRYIPLNHRAIGQPQSQAQSLKGLDIADANHDAEESTQLGHSLYLLRPALSHKRCPPRAEEPVSLACFLSPGDDERYQARNDTGTFGAPGGVRGGRSVDEERRVMTSFGHCLVIALRRPPIQTSAKRVGRIARLSRRLRRAQPLTRAGTKGG